MVTIFKNIFSKEPFYGSVQDCLSRIKQGKSKLTVEEIRKTIDKERASELKKNLPSICFSGKFKNDRKDASLIEHSGFICLDFDNLECPEETKKEVFKEDFVEAAWISPSGNGVKALVKIADTTKHKEHFQALQEVFKEIDKSGINVSRVCYESFDPDLFQKESKPFKKFKTIETLKETRVSDNKVFENILKWLSNKGDAFRHGERNIFLFKLASACCRFGMNESETLYNFNTVLLTNSNDFSESEADRTIKSAYRANNALFGSAQFSNEVLVTKGTTKEVDIPSEMYDLEVRPKDVIYGEDVKSEALEIYQNGYKSANTTHIPELDYYFKWKTGEITLLSGIGNYGKSTFLKYLLLMQVIVEGKKFALFSPEDNPAAEFYHDLVETYFGMNCTNSNPTRPSRGRYEQIYDWISKHIFYVYPKDLSPTPEYIKERFLELIIKEKINGCIIDPFNQMTNDYSKVGGRDDRYLETVLSDFSRFAQINQVYFLIVAHPKPLRKADDGNYPCPDVFDLAGGAMWNNKMDNILVYHRPDKGMVPDSTVCEFHSKKIRRQKIVGKPGVLAMELSPKWRRFFINGKDYMQIEIEKKEQQELPEQKAFDWKNIESKFWESDEVAPF